MIYKFQSIFIDKIWGGDYFKKNYYSDASETCGEVWGISGIEGKSSITYLENDTPISLNSLYKERHDLFGYYSSKEFPLLIKLIEAKSNLSIQVHPNDDYAMEHYNSPGKSECWYIIDAKKDSDIIVGHTSQTKAELVHKIELNEFEKVVNRLKIKKGDMVNIPSGMVHSINEGTVILEVQQASDITFRIFDYNRLENGKQRELNIKEALKIITVPSRKVEDTGNTEYFSFKVRSISNGDKTAHQYGDYYFVMEGNGFFDDTKVQKGDFIFIPSKVEYKVTGNLKVGYVTIK